ncbi:MAG: sensor histidine kinase [Acidobacteria bacterium]|nr:sensor histidine kinase [Acidobacteriota bacterium]
MPTSTTNRSLWILTTGFALVIFTLALLAWLGFNRAEGIRRQAGALVDEHLSTLNLIEGLEFEQHRASTLMLAVSRPRAQQSISKLEEFERSLPELAAEGVRILPSPLWTDLTSVGQAYANTIRRAMAKPELIETALPEIQDRYDQFIRLIDVALKLDAFRAAAGGRSIEEASTQLTSESGGLLVGALILALSCAFVTIRFTQQSLRRIAWQGRELNRVSWHLIQGQEEAARRFSHELHDELGQALTGLKAIISTLQPADLEARRLVCLSLLDETIGNVRELSQLLRPIILDDFGLPAALRWLGERFEERTRITVETIFSGVDRLADDVETHLYRITQEALTNIARHAGATSARLELLQREDRGVPRIVLTITDNGTGLPPDRIAGNLESPSLGLVGMRARAYQLGGTFALANQPGGGVRVSVSIPVPSARERQNAEGELQ